MTLLLQVKESWLDVQLCQEGKEGCEASNITSPSGFLKFPKRSNEDTVTTYLFRSLLLWLALASLLCVCGHTQFKAIFSSFNDVKVIKFSSVEDAFTGFSDKASRSLNREIFRHVESVLRWSVVCVQGREERFRRRVKRYVGIWCCEENKTPGHIYYDMYWDEKPGWKPVPPQTPEEDHPPVWCCDQPTRDRLQEGEESIPASWVTRRLKRAFYLFFLRPFTTVKLLLSTGSLSVQS